MEYNRDETIKRIQQEDAAAVQELKSKGWSFNK